MAPGWCFGHIFYSSLLTKSGLFIHEGGQMSESPQPHDETRPCPNCQATMVWTGLPDCSGLIYVRFIVVQTVGW